MNEYIYRVFNHKEDYQQSYSPSLDGSLDWAIDCAKRTNGKVYFCEMKNGITIKRKLVDPEKGKN